jgi:uncharacterized repeat protein (TIGR02543 family)
MLANGDLRTRIIEGVEYTITFKYKIENFQSTGRFWPLLSHKDNTWSQYSPQSVGVDFIDNTDGWVQASMTFVAAYAENRTEEHNYLSLRIKGVADVYVDDVVISCVENSLNIYGSAIRFNTNGGKPLATTSGYEGEPINIEKYIPSRPGYKFLGWYTDSALTKPFTDTVYGDKPVLLYAKWQLGKIEEGFEDYPAVVKSLGISGAFSFYNSTVQGFDKANVHSGDNSLFRDGTVTGSKNFTIMRSPDYALNVGDKYTLKFWVKPLSTRNRLCTISLYEMDYYTGIDRGKISDVVTKISSLKAGEWQEVSYTFTATSQFYALGVSDGTDMYIDDVSITLEGYTGDVGGDTGDSSVSPIVVMAFMIVAAGVLLITGKKVFAK